MAGSVRQGEGGRAGRDPTSFMRYYRTLTEHYKLILVCLLVTLGAAIAYVKLAPRTYTAQAHLLVNPASQSDTVLFSLPVLHSTGVPTQDVLTASALITTPETAAAVVGYLHLHARASDVLAKVSATPLDQSNIIAIQAVDSSPIAAQRLANGFALQTVALHTAQLHRAVAALLPGLRTTVARLPAAQQNGPGSLGDQLTQLEQLAAGPDPTVSVASAATLPTSPTSPKTKLSVLAGLFVGLLLGVGASFAFDALDPRIRREEQVRDQLGPVPVLARVPLAKGRHKPGPLTLLDLKMPLLEQYRTLRATLGGPGPSARTFLMTGSSPSEGKTTSAINLATVFAQGGASTILIEADLRRPTISGALGINRHYGLEQVLSGDVDFADSLADVTFGNASFRVLAAHGHGIKPADQLTVTKAHAILSEAQRLADVVIIDSPPLTAVIDALPFALTVDEIIIVARLGRTRMTRLADLQDLLAQQGLQPTGVVLVGVHEEAGYGYGHYVNPDAAMRFTELPENPELMLRPTEDPSPRT